MLEKNSKIALVTGANRGLGLEVCRQLAQQGVSIILTARDRQKGEQAAQQLLEEGLEVIVKPLDVSDNQSVAQLVSELESDLQHLDILINNAGINFDFQQQTLAADLDDVQNTLNTNLFGAWRMTQACLPLLEKSQHGRIVNVSSGAGSFAGPRGLQEQSGGLPAYGISKTALNALTVKLSRSLLEAGILVNAVCPNFTATYPGTEKMGARPVPEGASGIVWAAMLPDDGPTGGFFRDGQPLPW
ncbi:SDR family oxidoreductase [Acaryochloris marina]|uniref:SDR family oxidoreductase n=1 Tax=Acaryochloris marina TaxID=155978 RepID=UPI001BAEE2F1|nr:SDR family oxidoreductase [Acaryochloris marina]QUY43258.1 SDR family oxidoreductase [Acaryochloris marina S15]